MPEVSVIIPNYNHAKYLRTRIESVLNQSYPNFELIILDDCSTDNSREIIEEYRQHPQISQIVYNKQNSGSTFKQWKKGITMASGGLIWIAESDDYCEYDMLETLIKPFHELDNVLLSYCQSMIVDENNHNLYVSNWGDPLDSERWKTDYIASSFREVETYLKYRNTITNASSVLFKKPIFEIDDEITRMRYCGDWLFWKKILLSNDGVIAFSAKPRNYFRTHMQNTRHLATAQKERVRFNELASFVDTAGYKLKDTRYDWIILWYFDRRALFKYSFDYFVPRFPLKIIARTYLIIWTRMIGKIHKALSGISHKDL